MTQTNAMGGEYQSAMPHEGQFRRDRMSRREAGFWLGLFAGITVGGLGTSYYYSEPPVASPTSPQSEVSTASAFEARAGQPEGGQ